MRVGIYGIGVIVLSAIAVGPTSARACPYSIRDSAFLDNEGVSPIVVCFVVKSDTPGRAELTEWVNIAGDAWLSDANVVAEIIDLDRPAEHRYGELLRDKFSDASTFPVAVLVSPKQEVLEVPLGTSGKPSLDSVMGVMASVIESPARDALRKQLVTSWCTVLLIESKDPAENARAKKAIQGASKRITGTITELDKVVSNGPHLVVVSPTDPAERVMLWSLGLWNQGLASKSDDPVRAAMVVGRGELRGPVLAGKKLTEQNLFESFEMLGRSCSCTTAQMWLSGPRLPLAWDSEMDKAVEEELGFDLDDPAVLSSIHGATGGAERSAGLGIGGIGYRETFFAPESEPNAPVVPSDEPAARDAADGPDVAAAPMPATPPVQAPPVQAPPVQAPPVQAGQQTVGIMIALGLVVLVAVTFVVIRRGRSATLGVPGDSPSRV